MGQERQLVFGPFRLDSHAKQLWRGAQEIPLQPQPLAVLRCLVQRRGRLVSKQELLREAWPGIAVSKTTLDESRHRVTSRPSAGSGTGS